MIGDRGRDIIQGKTGNKGKTGQKGERGGFGPSGFTGPSGPDGFAGFKGEKGAPGKIGRPGLKVGKSYENVITLLYIKHYINTFIVQKLRFHPRVQKDPMAILFQA